MGNELVHIDPLLGLDPSSTYYIGMSPAWNVIYGDKITQGNFMMGIPISIEAGEINLMVNYHMGMILTISNFLMSASNGNLINSQDASIDYYNFMKKVISFEKFSKEYRRKGIIQQPSIGSLFDKFDNPQEIPKESYSLISSIWKRNIKEEGAIAIGIIYTNTGEQTGQIDGEIKPDLYGIDSTVYLYKNIELNNEITKEFISQITDFSNNIQIQDSIGPNNIQAYEILSTDCRQVTSCTDYTNANSCSDNLCFVNEDWEGCTYNSITNQCKEINSCGNGIVESGESCGEPGLSCSSGSSCDVATCQCVVNQNPTTNSNTASTASSSSSGGGGGSVSTTPTPVNTNPTASQKTPKLPIKSTQNVDEGELNENVNPQNVTEAQRGNILKGILYSLLTISITLIAIILIKRYLKNSSTSQIS